MAVTSLDFEIDPDGAMAEESDAQVADALTALARPEDSYLRWPWPALDAMYGGMAPGTVHYVVGYSGMGKTTFIASALDRWVKQGIKVDVLPLELKANTFRTYMACQSLGVDPGLLLSGDFWKQADDPLALRKMVESRIVAMSCNDTCRIRSVEFVDVLALRSAVEQAFARGARALVVDHIDHVSSGERRDSDYSACKAVNEAALTLAKEYDLALILMSQANNEALKGSKDKLSKYNVLSDNAVLMGGYKRQVATGMLSLFRPLKPLAPGEDFEQHLAQMARCRSGEDVPTKALWANRAGISLMKSRSYGGREGSRIMLKVDSGYYADLSAAELVEQEAQTHGTQTARRPL